MATFVIELTKKIVHSLEADTQAEAVRLAMEDRDGDQGGAWLRVEPVNAEVLDHEGTCACGDRDAGACDEEWGPNCDLGNNPKYARRATPEMTAAINRAVFHAPIFDPGMDIELHMKLLCRQTARDAALIGLLCAFGTFLWDLMEGPIEMSERKLRWLRSLQREERRAQIEFAAAFPNWK